MSIRYSERLAIDEIVASVGSKGDSYDNALAESFNGLYKWELIYRHGPWQGLADVEFATLTYVDWFNQRRLQGERFVPAHPNLRCRRRCRNRPQDASEAPPGFLRKGPLTWDFSWWRGADLNRRPSGYELHDQTLSPY